MRSLWQVSWRNLTRNKKRFIFTLVAIVMGVMLTSSMLITNETTKSTFDYYQKLYTGKADFWILSNDYTFSSEEVASFIEHEHVTKHLSMLNKQGFAELKKGDKKRYSVRLTGLSSYDSGLMELPVVEGDIEQEGLILPESTARLWGKSVGDSVTFTGMGTMEITAIVLDTPWLRGPADWEEAEQRHFRVMVPLSTLQEWSGLQNQIGVLRFQVDPESNKDELLSSFQQKLSDSPLYIQPVVADDRQNNDVEGLYSTFYLVAILSIFISGFIVFNMIYASIMERKREFSVMKSLGYTNFLVSRLVFMEVLLLAVIGTLLGIPFGIWFADLFQQMLLGMFDGRIVYTLELQKPVFLSIIIGLCFPVLVACYPMYIAGKTPILQAMRRQHHTGPQKRKHARWILGLLLLSGVFIDHMMAFLLLFLSAILLYPYILRGITRGIAPVFGIFLKYPGKVAILNTDQHLNRNANTSAMLASGICLVLFLGAALASLPEGLEREIRSTFGGDMHVHSERPWQKEEMKQFSSFTGVKEVDTYHEVLVTWETVEGEKREFSIMSFQPEGNDDFQLFTLPDSRTDVEQWDQPRTILLGERAFAEWGGEISDTIVLNTPHGRDEFQVVGVVESSHYSGYVGFVNESEFDEFLNWPHVYHVMVTVENADSLPVVKDQICEQFGDRLSGISAVNEAIASAQNILPQMKQLLYGLLILVICLSSIGIGNTLLMNTIERTGEIGTMRANGFTGAQVKLMIICEGLIIGIAGIIVGSVLGIGIIYLSSISNEFDSSLAFMIPWDSFMLSVVLGIVFSVFASWLPASFAMLTNLQEALKYE